MGSPDDNTEQWLSLTYVRNTWISPSLSGTIFSSGLLSSSNGATYLSQSAFGGIFSSVSNKHSENFGTALCVYCMFTMVMFCSTFPVCGKIVETTTAECKFAKKGRTKGKANHTVLRQLQKTQQGVNIWQLNPRSMLSFITIH